MYVNKRVYWGKLHFFCKMYFVFVFAKILESSLLVWYNGLNDNRVFYGENMPYQDALNKYLQTIVGKRLDALNLACEMMMFNFEDYALHTLCLTRIIRDDDILVTTFDYQSWDGVNDTNNDERYFVEKYRDKIVGGTVTSVHVSAVFDVEIVLDSGVRIELFIKNGYHHFDDEQDQWMFFKQGDHSYPFITVRNKTVDIAENW